MSDDLGPHVGRDGDQQIKGDLTFVVRTDEMLLVVHFHDHEFGLQFDVLIIEHAAQSCCGARFGEGAAERRGVDELDLVADAALVEIPVGQEEELQRRHRALDRHLGHVEHHSTALPGLEMLG